MDEDARLPDSVQVPVELLFAQGVDEAALLTMLRLVALCRPDGSTTPLTPDELADALGRPRSTLYRHLRILAGASGGGWRGPGWVEVCTHGRCLSVRPTWAAGQTGAADRPAEEDPPPTRIDSPVAARRRALDELGIVDPKLTFLANRDLDPTWIKGWGRWQEENGWRLHNPQGYVIRRLEAYQPPASRYLISATETLAGWEPPQDDSPEDAWEPEPEAASHTESGAVTDASLADAHEIWQDWLGTVQAVVGSATYGRYVAGASVVEAGPDRLVIAAADEEAARWLEQCAGDSLRRAWRERTGRKGDVTFAVQLYAQGRGGPSTERKAD